MREKEIVTFYCIWDIEKWGIWLMKSFYLTQFLGEWGFCSWRDSFFYSLVFGMDTGSLLSSNLKNIYFYRGFSWEQMFLIGEPITDYFILIYVWEEYPFHVSDFNWSSNQTTILVLDNLRATKTKIKDLINLSKELTF